MQCSTVAASEDRLSPWAVSAESFPSHRSAADKLLFIMNYAVLAPSSHNTQPWRFRLCNGALELHADPTRTLPVADPEGREQVMSCGAALFNVRIALRYFGYDAEIVVLPEADEPNLLARIRLGPRCCPTAEDDRLFEAIPNRHTNRFPFEVRPLPATLIAALRMAARQECAALEFIDSLEKRNAIAALVDEGNRRQYEDLGFRRELAAWVHPNRSQRRDGLPGYAFGMGGLLSYVGPIAIRVLNDGESRGQHDRRIVEGSPLLVVLTTPSDTRADWLSAGQALQRVLLRAAVDGVSASFLNQPIQLPDLRLRLRDVSGGGHPQMLIRLGYGPAVKPTPRRPVSDVLEQYFVDQWY
jgi:hypothetical protein